MTFIKFLSSFFALKHAFLHMGHVSFVIALNLSTQSQQ